VLLVAEWRSLAALRVTAKLFASLAFVAVGLMALGGAGGDPHRLELARTIVVGLMLGALGDCCLIGAGKRWFLAGLVAFLLGHVAYAGGIARVEPVSRWLGDAGWFAAAPIAMGLAALVALWTRLGPLRLPVIMYVVAITALEVAAIAAWRGSALPSVQRFRMVTGVTAFFASDLAVARKRFATGGMANQLWGLPAYYAGQLLLAWSIAS
jgi:uncharacterized membrane protein YhhN